MPARSFAKFQPSCSALSLKQVFLKSSWPLSLLNFPSLPPSLNFGYQSFELMSRALKSPIMTPSPVLVLMFREKKMLFLPTGVGNKLVLGSFCAKSLDSIACDANSGIGTLEIKFGDTGVLGVSEVGIWSSNLVRIVDVDESAALDIM
jgi:hypothetical protein